MSKNKVLPKVKTPWSPVGYLTYKRTYSRPLPGSKSQGSPSEEFPDTIARVINACDEQLHCGFTPDEEQRLASYLLGLKGSVAGRFLWQLGTSTVDRLGLASLQNCAFTVVDSPVRPFTWAMDMLALGSGVGYSIQREHVDKLPAVKPWFKAPTRVDDNGADFIIPDSREGWVKFLGKTLKAAFLSQSPEQGTFTYSTKCVRPAGQAIKGFGGTASGPEDLAKGIQWISEVLTKRLGEKVHPVDCLDIMNIIGYIIVAGNVRRSAQIAIGDCNDIEFLHAKRWDLGILPCWRGMSNNSVVCSDINDLPDCFWDGYVGNGEPYGLINLELSRSCGRLGETNYPDPGVMGFNPCAEQSLDPYETCCLAEVYLPNISSAHELRDLLMLLYRINKHSLMLPCHNKETEEIVRKNMRMGIGMTGLMMASKEQVGWLTSAYEWLRAYDRDYSDEHGFNRSIKLTTVKPSGTLSLLPGVTPGIHPAYARFMYRRIRIAADNPLVATCKAHGYPVEYQQQLDGTLDHKTVVVTFPFSYPENAVLAKDVSAVHQLRMIRIFQTIWSDNSVSCTVYFKKDELPEIRKYLGNHYSDMHKSLSFLLHDEHGYPQAPYEEISEEQYGELVAKTRVISQVSSAEYESNDECASGVCPIR